MHSSKSCFRRLAPPLIRIAVSRLGSSLDIFECWKAWPLDPARQGHWKEIQSELQSRLDDDTALHLELRFGHSLADVRCPLFAYFHRIATLCDRTEKGREFQWHLPEQRHRRHRRCVVVFQRTITEVTKSGRRELHAWDYHQPARLGVVSECFRSWRPSLEAGGTRNRVSGFGQDSCRGVLQDSGCATALNWTRATAVWSASSAQSWNLVGLLFKPIRTRARHDQKKRPATPIHEFDPLAR